MTSITLSIDDEVYKKMKNYSDIKWSEFMRMCIQKRIEQLQKIEFSDWDEFRFLADEKLLAEDWLSPEDEKAWKDL